MIAKRVCAWAWAGPSFLVVLALLAAGCPGSPARPGGLSSFATDACAVPAGFTPPSPLREAGATCAYAAECATGLCNGGRCVAPSERLQCGAAGLGHGVVTTACANPDALVPLCVPAEQAAGPVCATAGTCDLGSECSDHTNCSSGWCYALPGHVAGTCVAAPAPRCPYRHEVATLQRTDPVTLCVPAPCDEPGCRIVEVATGLGRHCLREASGAVACWDAAPAGFAIQSASYPTSPWPVAGLTDAIDLDGAADRMCAVRASGALVCLEGERVVDQDIGGLVQLALGAADRHSCAVTTSGDVVCWGANESGQLGNGRVTPSPTPVRVNGLTEAVEVAVGYAHSCARRRDGTVWCWGASSVKGDGTDPSVPGVTGAMAIIAGGGAAERNPPRTQPLSTGPGFGCTLGAGGAVTCWTTTPAAVPGLGPARAIAGDQMYATGAGLPDDPMFEVGTIGYACAALTAGGVTCWFPADPTKQLVQNLAFDGPGPRPDPAPMGAVTQLDTSHLAQCALLADGSVACGRLATTSAPGFHPVIGTRPAP